MNETDLLKAIRDCLVEAGLNAQHLSIKEPGTGYSPVAWLWYEGSAHTWKIFVSGNILLATPKYRGYSAAPNSSPYHFELADPEVFPKIAAKLKYYSSYLTDLAARGEL